MSTRPLVVRFGALGDMVLMTAPIRRLHERYGVPVDVLGSGPWTRPLLEGQSGVGHVYLLSSRRRPYALAPDQWRLVRDLRRRGPGPTWLFDARNDKTRWLLGRAGWGSADLITLDRLVDIRGEHFCDRWGRFAELEAGNAGTLRAADDSGGASPRLEISAQSRADSDRWLEGLGLSGQPLILVQVGNKRTMRHGAKQFAASTKYWPERCWAAVLEGLRALHPESALLLLGVTAESAMNEEILEMARVVDAHDLARDMTVARLMALCQHAVGMISVDTGPAHVASAMGCPVLVLFDSPAKVTMYTPRGPRGHGHCLVGGTDTTPSMRAIDVPDVLRAWRDMLAENPAGLSEPYMMPQSHGVSAQMPVQCAASTKAGESSS